MLTGKHALVTGGGTGIGLAIARGLAQAGAQVTITCRRADILEAAAGPGLHPLRMDVGDEASVRAGVGAAVAARGPVQVCIPNAAIADQAALPDLTLAQWRATMRTNLDGAFLTIRECFRAMSGTGWGRVVAISSISGIKGTKRSPHYAASKHGLVGLIRALAADHLGQPYTFNAICPAYVETDVVERNIQTVMARDGMNRNDATTVVHSANVHGRMIPPEDIAQAVLWLCGPGSDNVNGQAIEIAGGEF